MLASSKQLWTGLVELVFPPTCVNCGRVGTYLCPICWADDVSPPIHEPPVVENIAGVVSLASHTGAIREALHALKYEGVRRVAEPLGEHLAQVVPWTIDAIVPVPLHYQRLQERGYNQAELIAQSLAKHMKQPLLTDVLHKHKSTVSQVNLNAAERRANVEDVFSVEGHIPPKLLIVDDVCTTGATLGACASVLKAAGATHLYAATISLAQ